jgi:hypothetical protein
MTILVEKCADCFKTCFGADVPGDDKYRPAKVFARDVFCPDGHHRIDQEWDVAELRRLLDTNAPLFHCEQHAYRWNPDVQEVEILRRFTNAFDGGGLP